MRLRSREDQSQAELGVRKESFCCAQVTELNDLAFTFKHVQHRGPTRLPKHLQLSCLFLAEVCRQIFLICSLPSNGNQCGLEAERIKAKQSWE